MAGAKLHYRAIISLNHSATVGTTAYVVEPTAVATTHDKVHPVKFCVTTN